MPATSIAHKSEEALGGLRSVLVLQRRDHQRLNELLAQVRTTSGAEQDGC